VLKIKPAPVPEFVEGELVEGEHNVPTLPETPFSIHGEGPSAAMGMRMRTAAIN